MFFSPNSLIAKTIDIRLAQFAQGDVLATNIALEIAVPVELESPWGMHLRIDQLALINSPYLWRKIELNCAAEKKLDTWQCEGPIAAREINLKSGHRIQLRYGPDVLSIQLVQAQAQLGVQLPIGRSTNSKIKLVAKSTPLAWVKPIVQPLIEGFSSFDGLINFALSFEKTLQRTHLDGSWQLYKLNFDSVDGSKAGANWSGDGNISYWQNQNKRKISIDGKYRAGEFLLAPIYLSTPIKPIAFELSLTKENNADWIAPRFSWRDPDQLQLVGNFSLTSNGAIRDIHLSEIDANLPAAYKYYAQPILASTSFAELETSGEVSARLNWDSTSGLRFDLLAPNLRIHDNKKRFSVDQLAADIHWNRSLDQISQVTFTNANLYQLPIKVGAPIKWLAYREKSQLLNPVNLKTLGGIARIDYWRRVPGNGVRAPWESGLTIDSLDLASLCKVLDWPEFGGKLSGQIPRIQAEGENYQLDGGLELQLFDGRAQFTDLAIERPFGVAPSLAGNLKFDGLDLKQLTRAFSFGNITGYLRGEVNDLRLVNWAPTQFNASLLTDKTIKAERRISQNAVADLARVGGGGALVQSGVLRLFDSFPYDELGINCKLHNNVCVMTGLSPNANGYTIVQGAGFPRLSITGFQKRVDWPVLMARLKAATQGKTPEIR